MSTFYNPTPTNFYDDYIAHHGILGMKWGKQNGPPYPLGSGDHSKSERSAGWKKSLGGGRNEEMYDRKKKFKAANKVATVPKKKDRHERAADASSRDAEDLRKHGYKEEADAVQKVSDQQRAKSKTANNVSKDFNSSEKVKLNEKELKKWYNNKDNERPEQYLKKYEDEFDNTEKGKKLYNALSKEYDEAFGFGDENYDWNKFSKVQDEYLKAKQEYSVNKFLNKDANKFTLEQIAYDQYPLYYRPSSVSEQEVKKYLLEEQWKLHRV